jgi:crotonobetaine/carnitine-CoA ligase
MNQEAYAWAESGNAAAKLHPGIYAAETVRDILDRSSEVFSDRFFLTCAPTGKDFTFRAFRELCRCVAGVFREKGIEKGDRVALYMKNSPEYLAAILSCADLGAIQVPVNFYFKEREVAYVLTNSEAKMLIYDDDMEAAALKAGGSSQLVERMPTKQMATLAEAWKGAFDRPALQASDPFAIIYTSGTTGMPKGAVLSHLSYSLPAKAIALWPAENMESDYTCLPLFHINAQIYSALGCMASGLRLILSDRFSPPRFWEEVRRHRATTFNSLGSLMQILMAIPPTPADREHDLRYVIVGGTPKELWTAFEERFGIEVLEGYSQTEDPLPFLNPPGDLKRVGSFGVPAFPDLGHEVRVVDDDGRDVNPGERGELIRRSPCTMLGYYRDDEKTRDAVRDGWLRSGDVVVRDEEGYCRFVERKKFVIRRSAENIAAFEVEAVIKSLGAVKDCAVIPVPDPVRGEEVKAVIEIREGDTLTPREVVEHVAAQLAYFKVPRYIEFIPSLPYTPTGKLVKHGLISEERQHKKHGWDREAEMPDWKPQKP